MSSAADSSPCGDWLAFKDEKCLKVLDDTLRNFAEAESACAQLDGSPTLPVIHTPEEQTFITTYLFKTEKKVDNYWIGAKSRENNTTTFQWVDHSNWGAFTNWDSRIALHKQANYCVQLQAEEEFAGKWITVPCERKGAVVCQKSQAWTLDKLQRTLLETRKEFKDNLDEAKKQIVEQTKQTLLPIGFIYVQLPSEKTPSDIWPWTKWTDISATYGGVFFRVEGAGSESFGKIQEDNAPRIVDIENSPTAGGGSWGHHSIGKSLTTNWIYTGDRVNSNWVHSRFTTSGGEVRPKNMAIRVWKRSG